MVLCYHGVRSSFEPSISSVPPGSIELQLDYLLSRGWRTCDLAMESSLRQDLAVTLDDALESQVEGLTPLLNRRGIRATLFVPAGLVGQTAKWDYFARDRRHAAWSQLSEWCRAGGAVGSHGMSHRDLRSLSDQELERELGASRGLLEERLAVPVTDLSYPFGRADARVMEFASRAGYERAYTTQPPGQATAALNHPRIVVSRLDTPLSVASRAEASLWGQVERGKQRIISYWSLGTALWTQPVRRAWGAALTIEARSA